MTRFLRLALLSTVILLLIVVVVWSNLFAAPPAKQETEAQQTPSDLPADCHVSLATQQDISILPDADMGLATANFISYRTASDVAEAAQFYQTELAQNGWLANVANEIKADQANLVYTKTDVTALLMIQPEPEGGSKVVISINTVKARPG